MNMYVVLYLHIHIHTYTHTHTYSHIHTHTHTRTQTYKHTYIYTHMHTHIHSHTKYVSYLRWSERLLETERWLYSPHSLQHSLIDWMPYLNYNYYDYDCDSDCYNCYYCGCDCVLFVCLTDDGFPQGDSLWCLDSFLRIGWINFYAI